MKLKVEDKWGRWWWKLVLVNMLLNLLLEKIGLDPNNMTDPLLLVCFAFFIISSVILLCFFNISLYYISIIMIKDYEERINKYP